ncbi:CRISPR-associated protein Cas5 [Fusobacterium polymorphum]|uniref:CRISPR-associated protein Cas5 n=1 Tax=Fusobacterium nucleatum subsp. polymorphum TaxID=76857 RepID=A0A2C6BNE8_FUSNP|nr:CRISPR-associated protein Cas5 [Fusobacterium polymorphum]PHI05761.1 CRISPR-associated protein Cas5 [Fusobacterium polymorphum]
MKVLRIILKQSFANYRKAGTVDNKMTYPLPIPSTVIGALHNICGYTEYHSMDISIQGNYEAISKDMYKNITVLNTVSDRGTLVKMIAPSTISNAYIEVAEAVEDNANFITEKNIRVKNRELLEEFKNLKVLKEKLDKENKIKTEEFKTRKKELYDKDELKKIRTEEKKYKEEFKKFEEEKYTKPYSQFRTIVKKPMFYELLNGIFLILHIKSDEKTLKDIENNIFNLQSLGRSEDFVEVIECKIVELQEFENEVKSAEGLTAYLNYSNFQEEKIFNLDVDGNIVKSGTKYYLDKSYQIIDGKREFKKVIALYSNYFSANKSSENVKLDDYKNIKLLVNFI